MKHIDYKNLTYDIKREIFKDSDILEEIERKFYDLVLRQINMQDVKSALYFEIRGKISK